MDNATIVQVLTGLVASRQQELDALNAILLIAQAGYQSDQATISGLQAQVADLLAQIAALKGS